MKKTCLILAAILFLSLALPPGGARADVLWEPEDDFYNKHSDECVTVSRIFYANGEDGYVSMKKEPGARREVGKIENGETIYIQFTYNHNGESWGIAEFTEPKSERWTSGWTPMDQLQAKYDYISFDEEHSSEYYSYSDDDTTHEPIDIVLWTWPGSGEIASTLQKEWLDPDTDSYILNGPTRAYKDSDGREWGFVGYFYGSRNSWICLSDPSNDNIPAFNPAPEPVLRRAGERTPENVNSSEEKDRKDDDDDTFNGRQSNKNEQQEPFVMSRLAIIGILVGGLVVASTVLIVILVKRKR